MAGWAGRMRVKVDEWSPVLLTQPPRGMCGWMLGERFLRSQPTFWRTERPKSAIAIPAFASALFADSALQLTVLYLLQRIFIGPTFTPSPLWASRMPRVALLSRHSLEAQARSPRIFQRTSAAEFGREAQCPRRRWGSGEAGGGVDKNFRPDA